MLEFVEVRLITLPVVTFALPMDAVDEDRTSTLPVPTVAVLIDTLEIVAEGAMRLLMDAVVATTVPTVPVKPEKTFMKARSECRVVILPVVTARCWTVASGVMKEFAERLPTLAVDAERTLTKPVDAVKLAMEALVDESALTVAAEMEALSKEAEVAMSDAANTEVPVNDETTWSETVKDCTDALKMVASDTVAVLDDSDATLPLVAERSGVKIWANVAPVTDKVLTERLSIVAVVERRLSIDEDTRCELSAVRWEAVRLDAVTLPRTEESAENTLACRLEAVAPDMDTLSRTDEDATKLETLAVVEIKLFAKRLVAVVDETDKLSTDREATWALEAVRLLMDEFCTVSSCTSRCCTVAVEDWMTGMIALSRKAVPAVMDVAARLEIDAVDDCNSPTMPWEEMRWSMEPVEDWM
jgi:hypothetical protein